MPFDLVTPLPAPPVALLEAAPGRRLVVALTDGLAAVEPAGLRRWLEGPVEAAALGPDGAVILSRDGRILRLDPAAPGDPQDVTAAFAAAPHPWRRVVCAPDGQLWAEAGGARRRVDGAYVSVPACPLEIPAPAPVAMDVHGNLWSLAGAPGGRQVLVLPASAQVAPRPAWQLAWLPAGGWQHLAADSVGYVWVAGPQGWRRLCPRLLERGWETVALDLPGAVTAVGLSPDARVLAACAGGELLELDTDADGDPVARPLDRLPDRRAGAARLLHTDRDGAVWAATDAGLYRRAPTAAAWQHTWVQLPGRLPGGGNHDVFATHCRGRIYVAGGWAGARGLPVSRHVGDELFALDPRSGYWEVVSRMHIPRRYNGIATLEDRVWIVGGETRTAGRDGEGQALYLVDIHDPATGTWSPGPALHHVRTDPFVVTCGGRIWAIGGAASNSGPKLDTVESIGPGETTWRLETPLPEPTRQGHACVLDGVIECCSIDGVFAFDTRAGGWLTDLPQPGDIGQGPLAAAYRGQVWLIGGHGDRGTRRYDPAARTWRPGPDLPTAQAWGAALVVDDVLYVIAGAHTETPHGAVVYDDRSYALRDTWRERA